MAEVHFSICDSDETGSKNLNLAHIVVDGDESQPQAGAFPHASWSSETEGCCNHGSVSGQVMMRRNVLANTPGDHRGPHRFPPNKGRRPDFPGQRDLLRHRVADHAANPGADALPRDADGDTDDGFDRHDNWLPLCRHDPPR